MSCVKVFDLLPYLGIHLASKKLTTDNLEGCIHVWRFYMKVRRGMFVGKNLKLYVSDSGDKISLFDWLPRMINLNELQDML